MKKWPFQAILAQLELRINPLKVSAWDHWMCHLLETCHWDWTNIQQPQSEDQGSHCYNKENLTYEKMAILSHFGAIGAQN